MSNTENTKICPMCGTANLTDSPRCLSCGEGLSALRVVAGQSASGMLFSPSQIAVAAFLGAPVAAFWLLSRNYRVLGQSRTAIQFFLWGAIGTAALLGVCFFLPEKFPNQAIPIGYTVGLYQMAKQLQGSAVAQHSAAGGRLGSWWTVVGVSLICLILIFVAVFGVVFFVLPDE